MSDSTGQFVVIAEFSVKEGERDAFLALAYNDANESLANEHGCHEFDVLVPEDGSSRVILHEVYTDRAAFEQHTQMPHYAPFQEGTAPLLADEPVVRFFNRAERPQN
ncbi:quinol monooxygenase YgiN [Kushneria sinocarnis]|uniref:Quinol monooxygenase YgiN n=1 Tax=Kushneria sinocarnis TaxID=595502 RepID=A0A420WZM5_9GAMM|nr:putative quinol monooxygenase [Kushneria sinocarnis]RKR06675.1 quinol monooxygenase YgiN [Kushneria sinocarnis]